MTFDCPNCHTTLSADDHQGGQLVRCPTCLKPLRVPMPVGASLGDEEEFVEVAATPSARNDTSTPGVSPPVTRPPPSGPPPLPKPAGRSYGFNCPLCSSRLAASESQGGTDGDCPTCGQRITIPILDRMGRLIDPKTREIIKPDPHPVHAYAAAGSRAPEIRRTTTGSHVIICPRCSATSPIAANSCKSCGCPFTMEGTTESVGEAPPLATAALVVGLASLVGFCLYVPGPLAILLGGAFLYQTPRSPGRGQAIAGLVLGTLGTIATFFWHFK